MSTNKELNLETENVILSKSICKNTKENKLSEEKSKKIKKRGRKPKNKFNIDTNINDYMNLSINNENHIIKIPISCLDNNENNNQFPNAYNNTDKLEYTEADCEFYNGYKEFEQSIRQLLSNYFNSDDNKKVSNYLSILKSIIKDIELNNEHINFDTNKLIPTDKNNFTLLDNILINEKKCVNNSYYDNKKKELFDELNNNRLTQIEILINKKYRHTKQISLLNDICHNVNNRKWIEKTDCLCFWCCHSFDNIPWGIPLKYYNGEFTLTGIYCSPNCAMADLINTEKNTNTLWEKIVLLNLLHHKIYETDENIVPAPDKISLKVFGGLFDINEYRLLTLNNKKNYNITFPPCNIMAPVLEETKKLTNQDHYFIPPDYNKNKKMSTELKIKRRKAKHTENSLFNFTTKID
jgi:hypothetical protein